MAISHCGFKTMDIKRPGLEGSDDDVQDGVEDEDKVMTDNGGSDELQLR